MPALICRWLFLLGLLAFPAWAQAACVAAPRVALTFDDGPHRALTPRVLEALAAHDARATFFLVGNRVRANSDLVRAMHAAGHEIGSHTHDHADLPRLAAEASRRQIAMGRDAVAAILPGLPLPLWRAPYGSLTRAVAQDAASMGMTHVSWTLDLRDYIPRSTLSSEILERLVPGDIVLLHDIQAGTVSQLPHLLESIAQRGYQMVTVSDLSVAVPCLAEHHPVPDMFEVDQSDLIP